MKWFCMVIIFLLLCGLCGCASGSTTDIPADSADIPADSIRFRVVTADNQPVVGAEMGCTSPWINGERRDDYCLMGTTDENGCLLWPGGEYGEIDFDISLPGQKIQTFTRTIKEADLGTEIVFAIKSTEP